MKLIIFLKKQTPYKDIKLGFLFLGLVIFTHKYDVFSLSYRFLNNSLKQINFFQTKSDVYKDLEYYQLVWTAFGVGSDVKR